MVHRSNDLENKLLTTHNPDLAWGALIASGIDNEKTLQEYLTKINILCQIFRTSIPAHDTIVSPHLNTLPPERGDINKARSLFTWLWKSKPGRYQPQGHFRLNEIINAQLDPSAESIGNCLGLTLLFNTLAQRIDLKAEAIHIEDDGIRPHVLSIVTIGQSKIDVENTRPNGFNFRGYLEEPHRELWSNSELIADIYHSIGNEFFERNRLEEAIDSYTKAIYLNRHYTKVYLNRGIALAMLGQEEAAMLDFDQIASDEC